MTDALTVDEILALPASVDIVTAGQALGVGRTKAHELARAGDFPVPLLRLGSRYRVRRSDLLELLGIGDTGPPDNGESRPNGTGGSTGAEQRGHDIGDRLSRPSIADGGDAA